MFSCQACRLLLAACCFFFISVGLEPAPVINKYYRVLNSSWHKFLSSPLGWPSYFQPKKRLSFDEEGLSNQTHASKTLDQSRNVAFSITASACCHACNHWSQDIGLKPACFILIARATGLTLYPAPISRDQFPQIIMKEIFYALYFALHFAGAFLGLIIAIHLSTWLGLSMFAFFIIKFMIMMPDISKQYDSR